MNDHSSDGENLARNAPYRYNDLLRCRPASEPPGVAPVRLVLDY